MRITWQTSGANLSSSTGVVGTATTSIQEQYEDNLSDAANHHPKPNLPHARQSTMICRPPLSSAPPPPTPIQAPLTAKATRQVIRTLNPHCLASHLSWLHDIVLLIDICLQ
jgi:hypothetical protein